MASAAAPSGEGSSARGVDLDSKSLLRIAFDGLGMASGTVPSAAPKRRRTSAPPPPAYKQPPAARAAAGGSSSSRTRQPSSAATPKASAPPPASSGTVRINKCFRETTSRREADRYIEEGRVRVNGQVATAGQRVTAGDRVTLDGKPVAWEGLQAELATTPPASRAAGRSQRTTSAATGRRDSPPSGSKNAASFSSSSSSSSAAVLPDPSVWHKTPLPLEERFVYLKLYKPRGIVCTSDTTTKGNIVDALRLPERVFTVGRLDKESTGLILLTSDGRVPNAVLRAKQDHAKRYQVKVARPLSPRDVERLRQGVVITTVAQRDRGAGKPLTAATLPCAVELVEGSGNTRVVMVLREGRNRQIRRMMEALGNRVVELHRDQVMGIKLGGLRLGEWAALTDKEMHDVRRAVWQATAAAATAPGGAASSQHSSSTTVSQNKGGRQAPAWSSSSSSSTPQLDYREDDFGDEHSGDSDDESE